MHLLAARIISPGGQMTDNDHPAAGKHMLNELGFIVEQAGDELRGAGEISPYMHVPGTDHLRTSILAMWADNLGGLLAISAMAPRFGVTLDLDVHLRRPAPSSGVVRAVARAVKAGRSVFVAGIEFFGDSSDEPFAFGTGAFMAPPGGESFRLPPLSSIGMIPPPPRLSVPLAERAACVRTSTGGASMPLTPEGMNVTRTMHGGLVAMVAEEAAVSLVPGSTLSSLAVRYLHSVRVGPAVADACALRDGAGVVEVRDADGTGKLAALATVRTFDA
jgi:acyl-coenzyme A thioesterase PaaI-like protein